MLLYPLRPPAAYWLAGLGLASLVVHGAGEVNGLLGLLAAGIWWMMAFKVASEALTGKAAGREGEAGFENFTEDSVAFRQILLGLILMVLGAIVWNLAGTGLQIAYFASLALLLPAIVVLVVMEDSLLAAFDPRAWFELTRRLGTDYVVVAAQIAALALVTGFAMGALVMNLPPWLADTLAHALVLYLMLASYHALGALLDRRRDALEIEVQEPTLRPSQTQATPEERGAVAEADELLALDKPKDAAAVLDRLIRGRGATAPVHTRYRALLERLGDTDGLVRHARDYVATLLHLGKPREALALYLETRRLDPGFELADPQPLSELIALAAKNQQSLLAVTLFEEFARRFPRDRDLVQNGLAAAKLMDRLDRDEQARRLLNDLLYRFPDHELVPELHETLRSFDR